MNFGQAIEALKQGKKVARQGWNGKGMFLLYMTSCYLEGEPFRRKMVDAKIDRFLPWIGMRTADNALVPWLASQTDILAEDWVSIE